MTYEEELQQLQQQYSAITAQVNALSQTVSPTNPYGTNPQQLKQLQSQQTAIHNRITFLQNQQKAQEQEQRAQQQYQQEADEFNKQLAEEKQQKQPQADRTKSLFKDQQAQDYGDYLDDQIRATQAMWDSKKNAQQRQQETDDDAFFNSTGVYERYAGARRRLNSINPAMRLFNPLPEDSKFVKEFEDRYKRKFGKDVDREAADQFYNEYSMTNVATNLDNVAAKMKQLTEQWYGSQIDKMAEQYTAGRAGGTLKDVQEAWNNALALSNADGTTVNQTPDQILTDDVKDSVDPVDYEEVYSKGPDAVYKWFYDLFFDYYRMVAYSEWLQEMINNGQFGTYQKSNDQMKQAQDILQNQIPQDKQDYEGNIQFVSSEWNKILSAIIIDNKYKRSDVDWSNKGGGHGTGFKATPQTDTPKQPQSPRGYVPEYAR